MLLTLLTLTLFMKKHSILGNEELKNIVHNGHWEVYAVTQDGTGRVGHAQ